MIVATTAMVLSVGVGFAAYRSWHLRWGATSEESAGAMAGDGVIERPSFSATRAITIDARPHEVFPWIAQVGFHRAGFYSYDILDNIGKPSARSIIPELQDIEVGTWIPMTGSVSEETAFRIREFERDCSIVWEKAASTWTWELRPIGRSRTRLVTRLRCRYRWNRLTIITDLVLMEVADFPMMRKMLLGLKGRAEQRRGRSHADRIDPIPESATPLPR
jgi:hypothetical protein